MRKAAVQSDALVDAREQVDSLQRHNARLEARLRETGREKLEEVTGFYLFFIVCVLHCSVVDGPCYESFVSC